MKIERLLQVNVATLAVTSTLLFGMGQRAPHLPMLVILAAAVSIWLTDVTGWFRLNRTMASIVAMGTFALVAGQMFSNDPVQSILTTARLLVYLQLILLFQRKDRRTYWQLIALSLLLVVVATVFNQGAFFGMLMVVYLFMAISAMALVFLYHESVLHASAESRPPQLADIGTQRPWPYGDQKSYVLGDGVDKNGPRSGPMRDYLGRLIRFGIGALVFTAVAFFILPRFGQTAWRSPFFKPRQVVGYSGKVELGELGRVIEDSSEVLRIEFTDVDTKRMYSVNGAIYLHGTILTRYSDHQWSLPNLWRNKGTMPQRDNAPWGDIVTQTVTIEPMDRNEVFCVQPCFTQERHRELRYDYYRETASRPDELCDARYTFKLRSNAFDKGLQKSITSVVWPPRVSHLLEISEEKFPTLVDLAERWMAEPGLPEDRIIDRARHLSRKLKNSERFEYSLESQREDFSIDPVEDFVKNNPRGHCEYFATTLILMLRSQGIPARMVVGYTSDEFNPLGKFFQVRQLHAHTWVEVYLAPDQVPVEIAGKSGEEQEWERGAWLRLDPTPGASASEQGTAAKVLAKAGRGVDWLEYLWNNYVMEMDRLRQQRTVYQPLVDWAKGAYGRLTSLEWWKEVGRNLLQALDPRNRDLGQWLSWHVALAVFSLGFAIWGGMRAVRFVIRRLRRWIGGRRRRAARAARTHVAFYQGFQALAARTRMHRADGETHREFARSVGRRLAREPGIGDLAALPEQITDAFYRVRFGQHPLDKTDCQTVELALARLEKALIGHKPFPRRAKDTTSL